MCVPLGGIYIAQDTGDTNTARGKPTCENSSFSQEWGTQPCCGSSNSAPSYLSSSVPVLGELLTSDSSVLTHNPLHYSKDLFSVWSTPRNCRYSTLVIRPPSPHIWRRFNSPLASRVQNLDFSSFCPPWTDWPWPHGKLSVSASQYWVIAGSTMPGLHSHLKKKCCKGKGQMWGPGR